MIVKDNQWYDVKVEVEGRQIRCYLDGELVAQRADQPAPPQTPPTPVYANAVRDDATGSVILRVVNTDDKSHTVAVNLSGAKDVGKQAQVEVLSGEPTETNTIDDPLKIAPKKSTIDNAGASFSHDFPANSVSVIRLKAQ